MSHQQIECLTISKIFIAYPGALHLLPVFPSNCCYPLFAAFLVIKRESEKPQFFPLSQPVVAVYHTEILGHIRTRLQLLFCTLNTMVHVVSSPLSGCNMTAPTLWILLTFLHTLELNRSIESMQQNDVNTLIFG